MERTGSSWDSRELCYVMKINTWGIKELADHCGISEERLKKMRKGEIEVDPKIIDEARRLSRRSFSGVQLRVKVSEDLYQKLKATGNISEAIRNAVKDFLESRDNTDTTNN